MNPVQLQESVLFTPEFKYGNKPHKRGVTLITASSHILDASTKNTNFNYHKGIKIKIANFWLSRHQEIKRWRQSVTKINSL